ncbi:MAG: glutathione S-transferase [Methylocystaceae bacterium]|nr:glutathione S-transferase [Methylocystaceae bacterium]
MTYPILYSFRRCPYAMRARMALYVSGLRCELREVVLRDKPAQMLVLSPKATVPVLQLLDGRVIEESLEIMHFALDHNDPHGWLSADPVETKMLIDQNDLIFKNHLDGYKYSARYENVDPLKEREKAEKILMQLNSRIDKYGFLCGPQASLVDYAIFPFVRQFAYVDMNWFKNSPYPALVKWLHDFLESDIFLRVMKKYEQWHDGDEVIYFRE